MAVLIPQPDAAQIPPFCFAAKLPARAQRQRHRFSRLQGACNARSSHRLLPIVTSIPGNLARMIKKYHCFFPAFAAFPALFDANYLLLIHRYIVILG